MKTRSVVLSVAGLALAAVFSLATPQAAQAIVLDITSGHCTGGCGTAPFGTVTVTQLGRTSISTVELATG